MNDFEICKAFIDGHVRRLERCQSVMPEGRFALGEIWTDVNGTLDSIEELEPFLIDYAKRGGRVRLMSDNPNQNLERFDLVKLFLERGENVSTWFRAKPFPAPYPGMGFDDQMFLPSPTFRDAAFVHPAPEDVGLPEDSSQKDLKKYDFLLAWEALGTGPDAEAQKDQILAPLLRFG